MDESTSTNVNPLTLERLREIYDLLSRLKRIVVVFAPYISNILCGEWVDRMMGCKEDEEGFIIPEKYRKELEEYKNAYVEWEEKMIQFDKIMR